MKNKDLLSFKGAVQHLVSVPYLSRVSLDSILSRLCLASLICICLMTVGVGKMWGAYSYSGTGTFTKQSSVDGDGYYVFVLTQGAFTNSCSSDQLGINTSYTGNTSSISNPATSIVMQVTGYTSGKYYIQNSSGSYLYSSATKKIAYSETSQYWTTGDSKLKTVTSTVLYMGCVNGSYYRAYSSSSTNSTSFVCVYKLGASYTITATRNNNSYGTVSVSGSTITAAPASGYRVKGGAEGYTVTTGTATVTNNGDNTFTVSASSNCTVQINFEAIPTYTLNYHDGDGAGTKTSVLEGTNLITALGTPAASCDATSTTFVGWSTTEITTKTNTPPSYVSASTVVNSTTAAATYYAVYAKATPGSSSFSKYQKVTSAPADWTTDKYVIATADAGKVFNGKASAGNYGAPATMSTSSQTDSWEISIINKGDGKYALVQNSIYIAITSNGNNLHFVDTYSAANASVNNCDWNIFSSGGGFCVRSTIKMEQSSTTDYRVIKYNAGSSTVAERFAGYVSGQTAAYLYKKVMTVGSTTYSNYSTTCAACTATPTVGDASLKGAFSLSSVGVQCASASAGENCSLSEYGFVWGTSNASGHPNKDDNVVTNAGAYSENYTNDLTPISPATQFTTGQTYYFRGYAKNNGDNYGYSANVQSFTPYQISYNANGGSGTIPPVVVNTGGSVTLPSSGFTKEGNSLQKWALNSADGTPYEKGAEYSPITADATFYAIWQKETYTIKTNLTNVANSVLPLSFEYTGETTTALNSTFTVNTDNFFLPSSITVTMGGATLTQGTHYTYNNSTGVFTFGVKITGNIMITASATAKLKSITITAQPTKRAYLAGQTFSSAGATVTASMGDETTKTVSVTWTPAGALSAGTDQTVTATYSENGIEETATTTINVYAVTLQAKAKKEAGDTPEAIAGGSPGAPTLTIATGAVSPAADANNYVFWQWEIDGALLGSSATTKSNSITNPTGAVTLTAIYHKPISITWLKGGQSYGSGTTSIGYNKQWKDLTPPTDPADDALGSCADKFMGWSNSMAAEWVKEDKHTAPAVLLKNADFSDNTTAITGDVTFRAVFATGSIGGSGSFDISLSDFGTSYSGTEATMTKMETSNLIGYIRCRKNDTNNTPSGWCANSVIQVQGSASNHGGIYNKTEISGLNKLRIYEADAVSNLTAYYGTTSKSNSNSVASPFSSATGTESLSCNAYIDKKCTTATKTLNYYDIIIPSGNNFFYLYNAGSSVACIYKIVVYYSTTTYSDYVTACAATYDIVLDDGLAATTNNGSATVVAEGTALTNISAPTNAHYHVEGYYTESACENKIATAAGALQASISVSETAWTNSSSQWVLGNGATFFAKWEVNSHSLTWDWGGGGTSATAGDDYTAGGTLDYGTAITKPANETMSKAGYTFTGWSSDAPTMPDEDLTITANWSLNTHTVAVSSVDHVIITATPAGGSAIAESGSNASVDYGKTITLNCTPDAHYSLVWKVYKTGDESTTVSVSGSGDGATFTMPDYEVTVTAVMTEAAYYTATFKNNGRVIDGYDAVKTYDGERPSAPTLTDITDACDKTDCNKFYGWIAEDGIWSRTIDDVSAKTIYRNAGSIPVVSGADVVYHAVWAKGTAAPALSAPTPLAYWAKQSITASTNISATSGTGTLNSNVGMTTNSYDYVYTNSNISSAPVITLSSLDLSGATGNTVSISFITRGSSASAGDLTVSYYDNSAWTNIATKASVQNGQVAYHEINGIPKTSTSVKLTHSKSTGSFSIGTIRIFEPNTTNYTFTKLTSSNTSGWTDADWDGYYIITNSQATLGALNGNAIGEKITETVSESSTGIITTAQIGKVFKITYVSENGYKIQGVGNGDYLNVVSNSVKPSTSVIYHASIAYNSIVNATNNRLQWNTSGYGKFGFYTGSYTAPTLYKIMEEFTEYRVTCCDHEVTIGTPTKTGSGMVTFASGGEVYAANETVATCTGATTITATVTPTNGYQCTALEFTRSDSEDLTPSPAISVPFTGAQSFDLTFEQDADDVTLNTTVTLVALVDHYIDNMHYNATQNKSGNYGTAPTLSDETKGEECTGLHYRFIGWIPEADMNMTTGVPTTTANMISGGQAGVYATGINYYAIWAEEE